MDPKSYHSLCLSGPNTSTIEPYEAALVKAARTMGYVFTTRTPTEVVVKIRGVEKRYGILHVLDFTSFRKRMGVVVREPNGRISVMVKGAICDILKLLSTDNA
ncbi:unnamed protein product [Schistosoma margrebowiei]|uniref:Uncharacterized protein n=1 Tax=Schistosoma margrebowiei TaxID=48269 RepID=A0A183N978_9TREM|nr:unnamed protein product [Schistosoma margrebowiei]